RACRCRGSAAASAATRSTMPTRGRWCAKCSVTPWPSMASPRAWMRCTRPSCRTCRRRKPEAANNAGTLPQAEREDCMELHRAPRMRCIRVSVFTFAAVTLALGLPAQAQSVTELAAYSGADRTQRLIEGARKENALMIYSSMTVADMGALINAFQAKYGIKAQHWRGSSEDIRNRITREYSASRYDAHHTRTARH